MKAFLIAAITVLPLAAYGASPHRAAHHPIAAQPQIACTDVGCLPVPRGCSPAGGKNLNGTPTGFDVMVCPDGTRYGHL
jgi:hypothetical protein